MDAYAVADALQQGVLRIELLDDCRGEQAERISDEIVTEPCERCD